jgi:ligand-binding sensor domain-containing protein
MHNVLAYLTVFLMSQFVGCHSNSTTKTARTHDETSQQGRGISADLSRSNSPQEKQDLALNFPFDAKIGSVVRAIFQDSNGVLWIGGEGDLFRIDDNAVKSYDLKDDRGQGVTVKQIVENTDGAIWCGTTGGLTRIEGDSFTSFGVKDGLLSRDIWSMAADKDGTLWIGTIDGVCRFAGGSFSKSEIPKSKPDPTRGVTSAEIVHCITVDSRDRVWFGTNGGAYHYDGTTLTRISQEDGLPGDFVNRITEDSHGNIWIGTTHHGICRFDGQKSVNFTAEGIIEGKEICCIHEDRTGNIWFSGKHFGIYRYDGDSFTRFDGENGIDSPGLMCILEDSHGRMWLGGVGGLFRYHDGNFSRVKESGPWQ